MNLGRFIPNRLKAYIIAIQVNTLSRTFLRSKKLSALPNLFAGGEQILSGTALFPDEGFYVADVGAYRGWYTTIASRIVGSNVFVLSFEPEPHNFEILHKVILLGKLKNVKAFKLALSDNDGFEFLYLSEYPSMHSLVLKRSNKRYACHA
jgi:hypothetical protein